MRISRTLASVAIAAVALLGVSACSSDKDKQDPPAATDTTPANTETPDPTDADEATQGAGPADLATSEGVAQPDWAKAVTTPGTLLDTIKGDSFKVDIYQVGVEKSPKKGMWVDPDTNKPLLDKGDDIVFVNYVVTNTSAKTAKLSASLVRVEPKYDDWKYLQGMGQITDSDLFSKMDINSDPLGPDAYREPFVLKWEPGATFSYGANFKYQKGSPITFKATLTPVDKKGDLVHDKRQEAEVKTTIS